MINCKNTIAMLGILIISVVLSFGLTTQQPMDMTIDELMTVVYAKLGTQWYVMSRVKPYPPSTVPTGNPFAASIHVRPTIWYYDRIEVGITTLFKEDVVASASVMYKPNGEAIVFDVTPKRVFDALKIALPAINWNNN